MNTEIDVMLNLYGDLICDIEHIKNIRVKVEHNLTNMAKVNNNYFDIQCQNSLFNNYVLHMIENVDKCNELVNNLELLKEFIAEKIKNKCDHDWIDDMIDIGPEKTQNICYCVKCGVTKR